MNPSGDNNNNNSNDNDMAQSPIHAAKDNASLRSSSHNSLRNASVAPIDRLSTATKVEPSVSATNGNSFDAETSAVVGRTASTVSASQSLQSIIRKSSNNSLAGSPTKASKLDRQIAPASDDSTSIATNPHLPSAFIGTVLEGHSFTPLASVASTSTVVEISQPEASVDTAGAATAHSHQPADPTPTTQAHESKPPTAIPDRVERVMSRSSDSSSGRSSMSAFATWWSGSSSTSGGAANPGTNTAHEKSYTQPHGLSLRTTMLNISTTASSPTSYIATLNTTASAPESADISQSKLVTPDSMDWEPSGPESAILQKTRGLANQTCSSLPSSLPSSATFPTSMIKHTNLSTSPSECRVSTSSTQGLFTSILWSRLATSQDTLATTATEPSPLAKVRPVEHVAPVTMSETSSAMDVDGAQVQNLGLEISPTHAKDADDPAIKTTDTTPKLTSVVKLSDAQPSPSKKRWSIFGYGAKDDMETGPTKLRKSGDVLIEPESRPASINDVAPPLPTSTSTTTLVAANTTTSAPSTTTAATNAPVSASTTAVGSTIPTATKKTAGPGSGSRTPPQTQVTNQIADPSGETGPVAPALVGTSQLSVVVPPGNAAVRIKSDTPATQNGTVSSSYSWLSIIPGYGNKTEEANKTREDMVASHQITDYQEGDRKDINGSTISFGEKHAGQTFAQITEAKNAKESGLVPKDDNKDGPKERHTFAQLKDRENQENGVAKEAGKAVASLSKVILRKKNVVLPNYYEQYPDVHPSLITLPEDLPLHGHNRGRSASIMKSAVNVISNLLFSNPNSPQVPASSQLESQHRGANGIKKVAIIGVHGWFPIKLIRTVIGEPTGTSKKFCDEMHSALKDYLKIHNVELEPENCTLIPLEGEGKVLSRVEILYQNLIKNEQWKNALHEADLVLVATHSQGTPTSTLLVARLIEEGILRVAEEDPNMQRVGILAMAGISHGPFPFLKGNLIVRWFEAEAAQELFEFMDSETKITKKYREALRLVLSCGVRFTCVASLEDQVVPLYSAVMTSIHHPSIVRAVYIDGATYQDDFLTNLISFSLRLRNSGVDDHGVLVHLSEVVAGSIYGEGHSTIYEEREVYLLAIRSLLEPPKSLTPEMARSEPILHPFRAKQTLNPFYLPWGMRGVMDEIKASGDEALKKEMERLRKLYDEWNPVSKGMKEIKFRLEPVRSRL